MSDRDNSVFHTGPRYNMVKVGAASQDSGSEFQVLVTISSELPEQEVVWKDEVPPRSHLPPLLSLPQRGPPT